MTKPDDIPQWAWDEACAVMNRVGWHMTSVRIACSRALAAERESCAAHLEALAKDTPLGHENVQRGRSTYNWLTYCAGLIRNRKES